ncbi:hypothetical protein L1049_016249 [Liquidambar formosana]|uniref:Transcription repressor n=1 Tax=Liquidambar formosana TaxID=63359 RepID=A0AAP0S5W7_LIQFO
MSNIFWKNFNLCFPIFKCPPTTLSPPTPPTQDHSHPSPIIPSTTSIMIKSFNSLYDFTSNSTSTSKSHTPSTATTDYFFSSCDDTDSETPPDFATVFASHRFFFSSPGRSNSIFESPESPPLESDALVTGGVAVPKYSPDPYMDFRRSMQEMVESREFNDARENWEYLHELLLCYLTLNPKHTHKFIISAFADLVICVTSSTLDCHREPEQGCRRRRCGVSRRLL